MFYYFGYGSNLSLAALGAKGVTPISYEPAILQDWQLCFDIPNFFRSEGGTGNITPQQGRQVHGVLYECRAEHLEILDELEALGVTYRREKKIIATYSGHTASAYVYVGIKERCQTGLQPSRRYMNILINGAGDMLLASDYIRFLESVEVKPDPVHRSFRFPSKPSHVFTVNELQKLPLHTALAGAVFDMSQARTEHTYLLEFFKGKDMSLFFLKRMDSSDGSESHQDMIAGKLSLAQKRYLTNYLHEFDREYRYVGRLDYSLDLDQQSRAPVRLPLPRRQFIPSWVVLENAEKINASLGHENLGFLSAEHGFMPKEAPTPNLPPPFQAWDQIARQLPHLYRSLDLRSCLDAMPLVDASKELLSDSYLLRASSVLSMLAHAYTYVETEQPRVLPPSLTIPWQQVRQRLGRDQAVLSYIDLIVYNWRFKTTGDQKLRHGEEGNPGERIVENMDLMIPTVGNREECQFYLTQTEILAQCSPLISAIVSCQEGVKNEDHERLRDGLTLIATTLQHVLRTSLPKINPNPLSPHYVDAVVWAKTVAPFAVPMQAGIQGPSGTSSPIFNLLDVFFGRREFATFLGKEIKSLRATYPLFWRDFIAAVGEISISDYIIRSKDKQLSSILRETVDLYAGDNGFLGRHRMKVFGYLETAFKVGRNVTIGGFAGVFKDRTWDQVDSELEYARKERLQSFPKGCHYAFIKSIGQTHAAAAEGVKHVVLDISHTGITYKPGDRCGILPENSSELINKTLAAMEATGEEEIQLTDEWLGASVLRYGFTSSRVLKMYDFLKFGRIRPVESRLAEALHAATQSKLLLAAIKNHSAEQWELWDLLLLLKEEGYDVTRLWQSLPAASEYISRIIPPETFRRYSIASTSEDPAHPNEIHLTVGKLTYPSLDSASGQPTLRYGTASHFLASAAGRKDPISFIIERPAQFHLPDDTSIPIIMLAGGTGFAPFRGFINERLKNPATGLNWVVLGLNSREYFYYNDHFTPGLANGSIRLDVVFSREDSKVVFHKTSANNGELRYGPGSRGHIQDFIQQQHIAAQLWQMLKEPHEGGQGAYLYVCGRSRFASSCLKVLHEVFCRFEAGSDVEKSRKAHHRICKITATGRFMQEVFTHSQIVEPSVRLIDVSTVTEHNSAAAGYWMIIDNIVYDLTNFVGMHPGGDIPLCNYAGTDATQGFLRVHNGHSEIDAMRKMYEIGLVRQLDFKGVARQISSLSGGETRVTLAAFYRAWINTLYLIVEMENALHLDFGFQRKITTRYETPDDETFYKLQRAIETHQRFVMTYVSELAASSLPKLWQLTHNLCHGSAQEGPIEDFRMVPPDNLMKVTTPLIAGLHAQLNAMRCQNSSEAALRDFIRVLTQIAADDRSFISKLKNELQKGLHLFEVHIAETLDKASQQLLTHATTSLPNLFKDYYREQEHLAKQQNMLSLGGHGSTDLPVVSSNSVSTVILINKYWELEEHPLDKALVLRRNPMPVTSIVDLQQKNEELIRSMHTFTAYGIVVDMRQAPQRNDPEFEKAMVKLRAAINSLFPRVAILLESQTGVLQVTRIGRNDGVDSFVTVSESAALRFAKG